MALAETIGLEEAASLGATLDRLAASLELGEDPLVVLVGARDVLAEAKAAVEAFETEEQAAVLRRIGHRKEVRLLMETLRALSYTHIRIAERDGRAGWTVVKAVPPGGRQDVTAVINADGSALFDTRGAFRGRACVKALEAVRKDFVSRLGIDLRIEEIVHAPGAGGQTTTGRTHELTARRRASEQTRPCRMSECRRCSEMAANTATQLAQPMAKSEPQAAQVEFPRPLWLRALTREIEGGTSHVFLLHGNVRDEFALTVDGRPALWPIEQYLRNRLPDIQLCVRVSLSRGVELVLPLSSGGLTDLERTVIEGQKIHSPADEEQRDRGPADETEAERVLRDIARETAGETGPRLRRRPSVSSTACSGRAKACSCWWTS